MKPENGAEQKRPMTVEDLWALKRVGAPSLSPDGRWAAVEVTEYDMETDGRTSDVWLLPTARPSGAEEARLRLTTHASRDSNPRWSPDGKWIAFLSKRDGDEETQLYLISPEGGEARRLTRVPTGASAPKWFPDGKRVAFVSWVWPDLAGDEEQAKRLAERRESKVKAVVSEASSVRFWDHWLADGRVPHLFAVDVATGEHRDLFAGTDLKVFPFEESVALTADLYDIAPDGREVAFTADLCPDPGSKFKGDIVVLPVGGGDWTNITADNPASDVWPRYSPDGAWIAYAKQRVEDFYGDRQRVALYDRATGETRALTEDWDRSVEPLTWAPDGRRLYFAAQDRGRQPLWELSIDGGEPRVLVEGGTNSSVDVSHDGRTLAFLRSTMDMPSSAFAASAEGADVRKIETFNDELLARVKLGRTEEVTYEGWNGEPAHMWVVYPPDFDSGKRWPLLHVIHGGPHSAAMDQFHNRWNLHLLASRGHVVVSVNYHGSSGWGQEFTDSITGRYGEKEFEDLEKATDHMLATGAIDPERMAASGGSYGGYLVAWMNGHTDRYKAYVCHAGVYSWVSQMASDVAKGRDRQLGGFPWEAPEKVTSQSAHAYAQHFKTPTLVVHGELDYRVPVTQGLEYYSTLRMRGVPARLVYYPDENHWILKPQNSRLWYREFFGWIERFVGAGPTG